MYNQGNNLNSTTSLTATPQIVRGAATSLYITTSIIGDLTFYDNRDIIWFTGDITRSVSIPLDIN